MNFREFNNLINPNDQDMYIASVSGRQAIKTNASTIKKISDDVSLEVSWIIQDGYVVIETEQTSILELIKAKEEPVIVIQHGELDIKIIAKSDFNRTTKLNKLACGINANTYGPGKVILLPFKVKGSSSENLRKIDLVYGNVVGQMPSWLTPIRKISNSINDGVTIPIMGNQQVVLLDILSKMKATGLSQLTQVEIVKLVNKEFCNTPLQDYELENVLQLSEEQLIKQFFDKDKFFHDRLGNYVIKNCFVKRDEGSKELYFYNEKKKIYSTDVDYLMGYMTKLIPSLKHYQKEETLKYIQAYLYEESVRFNENPYTIVFKNGVLNINTLEFEPMTPNNHESIQLNCNYNPNAKSNVIDEYFNTATNKKQMIEELLYESIGYSMLKTNELQKAFLLVGSGRNGKSTFLDLVKEILGKQNTTAISFKDLANNFRASAMNNKLASLAGDISSAPLTDSDLFKSIVSGDEIMVEQKYKDAHAKSMFATLFFAANKMPRTPDQSFGFYRRFTIVPFVADLNNVSRVDGLVFKQKLLEQDSLDYAAYRAVKAIHKLLTTTKEFTMPEEVVAMMEQYKIENSSVLSWFHERHNAQSRSLKNMTEAEAYTDYKFWCSNSSRHALNQTNFTNSVKTEINIEFKKK
jgi:putative DNA primase/helicase